MCTDSRGGLCCGPDCIGGNFYYPYEDEPESYDSGHGPDCINDMYADAGVTGFTRRRGTMYDEMTLIRAVVESNKIENVAPGREVFDRHMEALLACQIAAEEGQILHPRVLHYLLTAGMPEADNHAPAQPGTYRHGDQHAYVYINSWQTREFAKPDRVGPMMASLWQVLSHSLDSNWPANIANQHDLPRLQRRTPEACIEDRWNIHAWFESIHPFTDGNGRVGRLLLWNLEMFARVPLTIFLYENRFAYYDRLEAWRDEHSNKPLLNPFVSV